MKAPEIAADEAQRLSQLRALNIMNTPAEERFDRLTRLRAACMTFLSR